MAPSARVQAAYQAMKGIGISEQKTKPVLKRLLQLYEKNWKLIEEENYRVLADAIFENEDTETTENNKIPEENGASQPANVLEQEPQAQEEPERPFKRLRRGLSASNAGPSTPVVDASALKQPKPEPIDESPNCLNTAESQITPRKNKGKQPIQSESPKPPPRTSNGLHLKEPAKKAGTHRDPKGKAPVPNGLIKPKDEPYTDDMPIDEVPLEVVRPQPSPGTAPSVANGSSHTQDRMQTPISGCMNQSDKNMDLPSSAGKIQNNLSDTAVLQKSSVGVEIAIPSGAKDSSGTIDSNPQSLMLVEQQQQQLNSDDVGHIPDSTDITGGEERLKISLVNDSQRDSLPSFQYIPQNALYFNANVKVSFAKIGDQNCCRTCHGDCLSSSVKSSCFCASGEGFAYTSEGLLSQEFLDEYISMVRDPAKQDIVLCGSCPLEKCKNEDMLEPCKGHLRRKFIKECWIKCGCSKICANRVVQRGITRNLQVFWTPEGKGWGLRTLEELPKGAFVCEFVGEILTVSELHQRSLQRKNNEKHSYAVVLDADWGSGNLQDDQSLCLDGTAYGNAARFVNHRCLDANLVEIPVQVETSDRHYYHVALFTTRKVDALEELTWDYGIDFGDQEHHLNMFQCLCGSNFCRNMKRSRSRSIANVH